MTKLWLLSVEGAAEHVLPQSYLGSLNQKYIRVDTSSLYLNLVKVLFWLFILFYVNAYDNKENNDDDDVYNLNRFNLI